MKTGSEKKKHFITLNLKLVLLVVAAAVMAFLVFQLLNLFETFVVQNYYLDEVHAERTHNEAYTNLNAYIKKNKIKSTDIEQLQRWVKDNEYTYLVVSDNYSIYFDGGWSITTDGPATNADVTEDQSNVDFNENNESRITPETYEQDIKNRIVEFDDGPYYVYLNVYREQYFSRVMTLVRVIATVATILGAILIYNKRLIDRVGKLSSQVQEVTGGNLTANISGTANDEVGLLADNVNTMRNYIVQRLQSEKEAWDKNSDLITAMSHDIRTPLTSLMGYLDILESGKAQTKEDEERYINACREKALQLKDLSDKLFQYFLVFGSHASDKNQEIYDAGILIHQIISEHSAELINYGFSVDLEYTVPDEMEIKADISGLRRLFDNTFSNIIKYADKKSPIRISAIPEEDGRVIVVRMINAVLGESRKVESNKIGLKTCEKICGDMGGSFQYQDEEHIFTVRFTIPVYEEKAQGEEEIPEGLAGIDIHSIDIENIAAEVAADEAGLDSSSEDDSQERLQ